MIDIEGAGASPHAAGNRFRPGLQHGVIKGTPPIALPLAGLERQEARIAGICDRDGRADTGHLVLGLTPPRLHHCRLSIGQRHPRIRQRPAPDLVQDVHTKLLPEYAVVLEVPGDGIGEHLGFRPCRLGSTDRAEPAVREAQVLRANPWAVDLLLPELVAQLVHDRVVLRKNESIGELRREGKTPDSGGVANVLVPHQQRRRNSVPPQGGLGPCQPLLPQPIEVDTHLEIRRPDAVGHVSHVPLLSHEGSPGAA